MKPDVLLRTVPHDSGTDHGRPLDRLAARLLAPSLDRQLATGRPPHSSRTLASRTLASRALAMRARQIVSPAGRSGLARNWIRVMDVAVRPPVPLPLHGPLCRGAVAAAERDVREMIAVLDSGLPIAAPGAALASWLLRDGTGPLHNHRSGIELSAAVREATRQMASFADTPPDGADADYARCGR
jgi:hypothetical protein